MKNILQIMTKKVSDKYKNDIVQRFLDDCKYTSGLVNFTMIRKLELMINRRLLLHRDNLYRDRYFDKTLMGRCEEYRMSEEIPFYDNLIFTVQENDLKYLTYLGDLCGDPNIETGEGKRPRIHMYTSLNKNGDVVIVCRSNNTTDMVYSRLTSSDGKSYRGYINDTLVLGILTETFGSPQAFAKYVTAPVHSLRSKFKKHYTDDDLEDSYYDMLK